MPVIGPGRRMARRRVVGAAVVGGAAYHAGKKGAEAGQEADQEPMVDEREPQAEPRVEEEYIQELEQLSRLHEQGIIDDEEFKAKKAQILGA